MKGRENYDNFQLYCEDQARKGNGHSRLASSFLKPGKNSLELAIREAERRMNQTPDEAVYDEDGKLTGGKLHWERVISMAKDRGMLDGSFELTYEGAQRIYGRVQELVKGRGEQFSTDYQCILDRFDPVRDSDLIATGLFCLVPEVRERVSRDLGSIYKVVLSVGGKKNKGHALPEKHERTPVSGDNFFPSSLRDLLASLPEVQTSEDQEYQRMLHVLIQKKAERDVFPVFRQNGASALDTLERLAEGEVDPNIRSAYHDLAQTYRG